MFALIGLFLAAGAVIIGFSMVLNLIMLLLSAGYESMSLRGQRVIRFSGHAFMWLLILFMSAYFLLMVGTMLGIIPVTGFAVS